MDSSLIDDHDHGDGDDHDNVQRTISFVMVIHVNLYDHNIHEDQNHYGWLSVWVREGPWEGCVCVCECACGGTVELVEHS